MSGWPIIPLLPCKQRCKGEASVTEALACLSFFSDDDRVQLQQQLHFPATTHSLLSHAWGEGTWEEPSDNSLGRLWFLFMDSHHILSCLFVVVFSFLCEIGVYPAQTSTGLLAFPPDKILFF